MIWGYCHEGPGGHCASVHEMNHEMEGSWDSVRMSHGHRNARRI
jgi:hypothetical protein